MVEDPKPIPPPPQKRTIRFDTGPIVTRTPKGAGAGAVDTGRTGHDIVPAFTGMVVQGLTPEYPVGGYFAGHMMGHDIYHGVQGAYNAITGNPQPPENTSLRSWAYDNARETIPAAFGEVTGQIANAVVRFGLPWASGILQRRFPRWWASRLSPAAVAAGAEADINAARSASSPSLSEAEWLKQRVEQGKAGVAREKMQSASDRFASGAATDEAIRAEYWQGLDDLMAKDVRPKGTLLMREAGTNPVTGEVIPAIWNAEPMKTPIDHHAPDGLPARLAAMKYFRYFKALKEGNPVRDVVEHYTHKNLLRYEEMENLKHQAGQVGAWKNEFKNKLGVNNDMYKAVAELHDAMLSVYRDNLHVAAIKNGGMAVADAAAYVDKIMRGNKEYARYLHLYARDKVKGLLKDSMEFARRRLAESGGKLPPPTPNTMPDENVMQGWDVYPDPQRLDMARRVASMTKALTPEEFLGRITGEKTGASNVLAWREINGAGSEAELLGKLFDGMKSKGDWALIAKLEQNGSLRELTQFNPQVREQLLRLSEMLSIKTKVNSTALESLAVGLIEFLSGQGVVGVIPGGRTFSYVLARKAVQSMTRAGLPQQVGGHLLRLIRAAGAPRLAAGAAAYHGGTRIRDAALPPPEEKAKPDVSRPQVNVNTSGLKLVPKKK